MHPGAVAFLIAFTLNICASTATAQPRVRSVNPEAIEFDAAGVSLQPPGNCRVEFFEASRNPERDSPIKSIAVDQRALQDDQRTVRLELGTLLNDIPDGEYIASIRTLEDGEAAHGEPSAVFVLSRSGTVEERLERDRRERFWTKVGLAIAGGILLVPYLLR